RTGAWCTLGEHRRLHRPRSAACSGPAWCRCTRWGLQPGERVRGARWANTAGFIDHGLRPVPGRPGAGVRA
ncbi:hypothetical protein C7E18_24300, partial [Stenotrophomonas maltophilia]